MAQERTIIELLELLKQYVIKATDFHGMCLITNEMEENGLIDFIDEKILDYYLDEHRPNNKAYWFPKGEKQPRIDWIEKQIKTLKL